MPTEYRFEDLDLREEPASSTRTALIPYTDGNKNTINCCSDYCPTVFC